MIAFTLLAVTLAALSQATLPRLAPLRQPAWLAPAMGAAGLLAVGLGVGWAWWGLSFWQTLGGILLALPWLLPVTANWLLFGKWVLLGGALALQVHLLPPTTALPHLVVGLGVLYLLSLPANELVTALLATARGTSTFPPAALPSTPPTGQRLDIPPAVGLRGGRWIGVLERILLLLLAGAGAHAAVAALVAAKGVIRFPEISADKSGAKAEEFLIGSLASWTLAVLGALLVHWG